MSIETRFKDDDATLIIAIRGRFDFSMLGEFRQAYSEAAQPPGQVVVDMRNADTIDSSALGMLLNMQRYLKKADREIRIINCNEDISNIFNITRFDRKFTISQA